MKLPEELDQMREETRKMVEDLLQFEPSFHRTNRVDPKVDQTLRELGYYGMRIPEAFGGSELGLLGSVAVVSELGRLPPQFWSFLRVALGPVTKILVDHGNAAQKEIWLPAIASGECGVAFALTEPGAGSDLASLRTRARRTGDGYVINGQKTYISNADRAGLFIVFARTNDEAPLKQRLSAFLVKADRAGIAVGPPMPTMGTTLDGLFEVSFSDCQVPANALLGNEGAAFAYAMECLNEGRLNVGAIAVSMAGYAIDLAVDHVASRQVSTGLLAEQQVVRHMLADSMMELEAARALLFDAAVRVDAGEEAAALSAMVKVYASEAAGRIIDRAVQLFGAAGYTRGVPVERLYRDVRVLRIYEGASEVLRNVIANRMLKTR